MCKNDIIFLVLKYTRLFCDCNCGFFGITGYHYHLYTRIIKYFNRFYGIRSYIVPKTKNSHKYGFAVNYFYYRKKLHSPFCLRKYLLFDFLSVLCCKFLKFTVWKYIMCNLVDNIFSCTLPVYQTVLKLCRSTLFLRVKAAYIFNLIGIIIGIIIAMLHSIGK